MPGPGIGEGWPPAPPNQTEREGYDSPSKDVQDLLKKYKVHYETWAAIAASGFLELGEFADRFRGKAHARSDGPAAYSFRPQDHG